METKPITVQGVINLLIENNIIKSPLDVLIFTTMIHDKFHDAELPSEEEIKTYEVDFSGHLKCKMLICKNRIEVTGAMNGYGNGIPLSEIKIIESTT